MAGNATPSQKIGIGADLQVLLGDLQGAAKTLGAEVKSDLRDAKMLQKELTALEKRKAKGENVNLSPTIQKLQAKELQAEQKKQRAADLKERGRDGKKRDADLEKRFSSVEVATAGALRNVKGSLDFVSKNLISTQSATAQAVGKSIGRASKAITPGLLSSIARVAIPAGVVYAGYKAATKGIDVQHNFRDRGETLANIRGSSDENIRKIAQSFITQNLSSGFLSKFNAIPGQAGARAAKDINRQDLIDLDFGQILKAVGVSGATAKELRIGKRRAERIDEGLKLLSVGETSGQPFAAKVMIDAIQNSPEVQKAWSNYLDDNFLSKVVSKILNVGGLTDAGDALLGKEKFTRSLSSGRQGRTIASEATRKASDKRVAEQDPEKQAERHIRQTRWQGLERRRLSLQMQTNRN